MEEIMSVEEFNKTFTLFDMAVYSREKILAEAKKQRPACWMLYRPELREQLRQAALTALSDSMSRVCTIEVAIDQLRRAIPNAQAMYDSWRDAELERNKARCHPTNPDPVAFFM